MQQILKKGIEPQLFSDLPIGKGYTYSAANSVETVVGEKVGKDSVAPLLSKKRTLSATWRPAKESRSLTRLGQMSQPERERNSTKLTRRCVELSTQRKLSSNTIFR